MLVGFQVFLDMGDTVFYLVTIVDVEVTGGLVGVLIDLDDCLEQFLDTHAALKRRGDHRHTEQGAEGGDIYPVATTLKLVIHVQGTDHADVHIHQLGGEVEVALQVGGIDDIDHHVGCLFGEMLAHIQLLRRIAGERIGAWQIDQVKLIAEVGGMGLRGIDGDTTVVADMSVGTTGIVEERGLATVGITHEGYIDGAALLQGDMLQEVVLVFCFIDGGSYRCLGLFLLTGLFLGDDLDHICLLMAERHLVAHQLVFYRVLQRCVQQHLNLFTFHETHLNDALTETTVA